MPPHQFTTVPEFVASIEPALRPAFEGVRTAILSASAEVKEGIKWNCLSFATTEYFAALTVRLVRKQPVVFLVLHTGAKVRRARPVAAPVHDPTGLLAWVAPDRATVAFPDAASVASSRDALVAVIQEWIRGL